MKKFVAALIFALAGCAGPTFQLDAHFAPLTQIREVKEWPLAPGRVSTLYTECVTSDLAAFLRDCPPGSVAFEACLRHEQVHALRQPQDPLWLVKYAVSPAFRWQEESAGWRVQLLWRRDHGDLIVPWDEAEELATGYDGMVDHATAEAWVKAVLVER